MKKQILKLAMLVAIIAVFSSCTTLNRTIKEPNSRVELNKTDFDFSDQVTGEAKTVTIIGIDWKRLLHKKMGTIDGGAVFPVSIASIPIVGNFISDKTANYALYEIMMAHPGYDVIFYPQYETRIQAPVLGIGFFYKITTVKTTARLGKLKK